MALVMAFDDARTNRHRTFGNASKGVIGGTMTTPFFGSRARSDLPQANLNEHDPGRISTAHFHFVDQFQVVVAGRGKLGRHSLRPYSVHFSRAYTPYGPLIEDAASGTTMFVLRARPDPGPHHLPQGRDVLKQIKDRQPWQVTCTFDLPPIDASGTSSGLGLQLIPGVKDEAGLAAYTLQMNASVTQRVPDPSTGGGQYIVVLKGSFLHDSKEHKALALVFVKPEEEPYVLQAGTDGLEALVLNFPRETIQPGMAKAGLQPGARSWRCMLCAFVYDEMAGMPEDGISPGTAWTDVPETWVCPDCGASKTDFRIDE